jgi:hypothetical protein
LDRYFSKEEVFVALSSMKNGKSPGMDCLPCEFYKATWDTIGDGFYYLAIEVFSFGCLFEFLNQGMVRLIPKNVARNSIGGWWPITFLIVAYKIMAKALALRIRLVARYVVH